MNNNSFTTVKSGWFTSKIEIDVSYEGNGTDKVISSCYEEGTLKALIAKWFQWTNENCVTRVGGRKIYLDKTKFAEWKQTKPFEGQNSFEFIEVDKWIQAYRINSLKKVQPDRLQILLNKNQLSEEGCKIIEIQKLSNLSFEEVPYQQIEKLYEGNQEWAQKIKDNEEDFLIKLIESNKVSNSIYFDVKEKFLEAFLRQNINWEKVSAEQILILCRDNQFLKNINLNILQILLNQNKLHNADFSSINPAVYKELNIDSIPLDQIQHLMENTKFRQIPFSEEQIFRLLKKGVVPTEYCNSFELHNKKLDFAVISEEQIERIYKNSIRYQKTEPEIVQQLY